MNFVQEITTKPGVNPLIENQYFEPTQAFYPSLAQSFLIIFLSEIADRTFILVLIYSLKMHWLPLIITSMLSMALMNILAIVAGYSVILLIPRNLLDWLGFLCFLGFGVFSIWEGIEMESKSVQEEYEEQKEVEEKKRSINYKTRHE